MWMANDGNYRELRWFTPWMKHRQIEDHYLPRILFAVTGQVRLLLPCDHIHTDMNIRLKYLSVTP